MVANRADLGSTVDDEIPLSSHDPYSTSLDARGANAVYAPPTQLSRLSSAACTCKACLDSTSRCRVRTMIARVLLRLHPAHHSPANTLFSTCFTDRLAGFTRFALATLRLQRLPRYYAPKTPGRLFRIQARFGCSRRIGKIPANRHTRRHQTLITDFRRQIESSPRVHKVRPSAAPLPLSCPMF